MSPGHTTRAPPVSTSGHQPGTSWFKDERDNHCYTKADTWYNICLGAIDSNEPNFTVKAANNHRDSHCDSHSLSTNTDHNPCPNCSMAYTSTSSSCPFYFQLSLHSAICDAMKKDSYRALKLQNLPKEAPGGGERLDASRHEADCTPAPKRSSFFFPRRGRQCGCSRH
jgi:hypothetical protein